MVEANPNPKSEYEDPLYERYRGILDGAEDGKVVTRFPPEPSGFLHIGHMKAAMLNYHYAKMYHGKMILRFDDTNPSNEKDEYTQSIIKDLETMNIVHDQLTYTSDYFPQIIKYMEQMIKQGDVYSDNTEAEEMKKQRDEGIESKCRQEMDNDKTMKMFHHMLKGEEIAKGYCLRTKMNMKDPVKCLRDPVFFRSKVNVPHARTKDQYKAYPTYDFACPIVDSLEGITHCLRTVEYHDRNALYWWVQEKLGLPKVKIYDYSRLAMISTVLSKRHLRTFVENGIVDGWGDPRFPTVQGIMRHGMTIEALKRFMLEQGPSRNTNFQEWDKIWAINKDVIDPTCPRYTGLVNPVKVILENYENDTFVEGRTQPLHPKSQDVGTKVVYYSKEILIEREDAEMIAEGEKITLMKWGNCHITSKKGEGDSLVLTGKIDETDKDFKKTKKLTWLSVNQGLNLKVTLVEYDHLITKKKVEEDEKVADFINPKSKISYDAIVENSIK